MNENFLDGLTQVVEIDTKLGYEWDQFVVEEVGELLSAIGKYKRGRVNSNELYQESADAILTIYAMIFRLNGPTGIAELERIIDKKMRRTIAREGGVLNGK